jgi:hypothetical protein
LNGSGYVANVAGVFRLVPLPGVPDEEFEEFLINDVFPSVEPVSRGLRGYSYELLKDYQGRRQDRYMWKVVLEHFGSNQMIPEFIPGMFDQVYSEAREKVEKVGVMTSFAMFTEISKRTGSDV